MNAFLLLVKTHLRGFRRDKSALFFTLMFPLLFVLMFGYIFGGQEQKPPRFAIGVVNEDTLPGGAAFVRAMSQNPIFDMRTGARATELAALKRAERRAVVIIPSNFSRSFASGGQAVLNVPYDESQMQIWPTIRAALEQTVAYADQMQSGHLPVRIQAEPIQRRATGRAPRRGIDIMIPGILAMSIMQLGIFCAIPLVREREQGILKRIGATPLPRSMYLVSQLVFRLIIGLLQTGMLLGVAMALFGVRVAGSPCWLVVFVLVGALTFMMVGGIIGSIARTTESAMPMVQMVNFPMMFLGGVLFPLEGLTTLPKSLVAIISVLPTRHLGDAMRAIALGQASSGDLLGHAGVLIAWMIAGLAVAVKMFRWE